VRFHLQTKARAALTDGIYYVHSKKIVVYLSLIQSLYWVLIAQCSFVTFLAERKVYRAECAFVYKATMRDYLVCVCVCQDRKSRLQNQFESWRTARGFLQLEHLMQQSTYSALFPIQAAWSRKLHNVNANLLPQANVRCGGF
jgi:hypothetical protein